MTITLKPEPLTSERFAPYGDVIEASMNRTEAMNAERFQRFDDLCKVDMQDDGRVAVSIARCRVATSLPLRRRECGRVGSQGLRHQRPPGYKLSSRYLAYAIDRVRCGPRVSNYRSCRRHTQLRHS